MKEMNLPSSFEPWDWEKDEDTRRAYEAITKGGFCSEFKITVWNALVDKVKEVLDAIGAEWNDKFGSYYLTKLEGKYPELTARKFNAVRYNIECCVGSTWRWSYDESFIGYVGRDDFKGVRDVSWYQDPDTVYGVYFVELARKLNLMITTLKGDANYKNITTLYSMDLFSVKGVLSFQYPREITGTSKPVQVEDALLEYQDPFPLEINEVFSKSEEAIIELRDATDTMNTHTISYTYADAVMNLEELYKNLHIYLYGTAPVEAQLTFTRKAVMEAISKSVSEETGAISFGLYMDALLSATIQSAALGRIDTLDPIDARIDCLLESSNDAVLIPLVQQLLNVEQTYKVDITAFAELITGSDMFSSTMATIRLIRTTATPCVAGELDKHEEIIFKIDSSLFSGVCGSLESDPVLINHDVEGTADRLGSVGIGGSDQFSDSIDNAVMTMCETTPIEGGSESSLEIIEPELHVPVAVNTGSKISHIFDVISTANKGIATWISHQSAHNLNIRISRPFEIYSAKNSSSATLFIENEISSIMKNIYYEGDVCVSSVNESFISNGTVLCFLFASLLISEEYFNTVDALINLKDASETMGVNENIDCIDCDALIELINPVYMDSIVECSSDSISNMDFDEASWQNPELINGDLYVYRVLDVVQNEGTIFIDCEVEE